MTSRGRSAPYAVLLAFALAAPLPAQAQAATPVEAVDFVGNHTFDDATLAMAIATNSGECKVLAVLCAVGIGKEPYYFDEPSLRADIVRLRLLYYEQGFREAKVTADTTAADGGVRVTFHIEEGRPVLVSDLTISGLDTLGTAGITKNLQLRKGDRFDIRLYDAVRDTLAARLMNRGYPRAEVLAGYDIRNTEPYAVSVRYNVMPGTRARFGPIDVTGAQAVSDQVVKRMLSFRTGDLYDQADILESQRNLFRLQVFRHVDIQPDLNASPDSVVPVSVQVNEGDTHNVRVGAGVNQAECVSAEGRWQSQNFMGGARQLQVRGRVSNVLAYGNHGFLCDQVGTARYSKLAGLITVDFVQPFFFGPANNAGAGIIAERRSVPNIFVRTAFGGYVSLIRRLGSSASVSVAYRPELTRLDADQVVLCTSFVGCAPNELGVLTSNNLLAPVTLSYIVDRSNDVFSPTQGHVLRADLEYASSATASTFAYLRWSADGALYHGLGGRSVLALHLRAGLGWSLREEPYGLNPQKRFFAGGANSVRGFGQYQLGPQVLTVKNAARDLLADTLPDGEPWSGCNAFTVNYGTCDVSKLPNSVFQIQPTGGGAVLEGSMELRLPSPIWGNKLRTAVFVDAGYVWALPKDILKNLKDIIATPGFGFRYESPVGPIRLDIAYNTQGPHSWPVLTTRVCLLTEPGCTNVGTGNGYGNATAKDLVQLNNVVWNPYSRPADTWQGFFQRLRLHFSIGQAF